MNIFKLALFICLFFQSTTTIAEVEIFPFKKFSWQKSWSEVLYKNLSDETYADFLKNKVDESDLAELGCPLYNQQTDHEKRKDFWIVFMSALTRAESAFNPRAGSIAPKGGHGNFGLLQFSKRTAREKCGLASQSEIYDPEKHLSCGLKLLSWQMEGAPTKYGHFLRPDLQQQLFGKYIFLWGPLRQNDKRGRALLVGWFKKHLPLLPFCHQSI